MYSVKRSSSSAGQPSQWCVVVVAPMTASEVRPRCSASSVGGPGFAALPSHANGLTKSNLVATLPDSCLESLISNVYPGTESCRNRSVPGRRGQRATLSTVSQPVYNTCRLALAIADHASDNQTQSRADRW